MVRSLTLIISLLSTILLYTVVGDIAITSNVTTTTLRFKLIHPNSLSPYYAEDEVMGEVMGGVVTFYVNISFGQPPVPQLLLLDTGSDLTWIKCHPCNLEYFGYYPIFEPLQSSSYSNLSCLSEFCGDTNCRNNPNSVCPFSVTYFDGTMNSGYLATEQLTLVTSDDGISTVSNFVFGCTHKLHEDQQDLTYDGMLGLSNDDFSLVKKLGSRFSYCLGDIYNTSYSYNHLIIGDGSIIQGKSTPMYVDGYYYVTLEGISLGNLQIAPSLFKGTDKIQVVIDTGTTLNRLTGSLYKALTAAVQMLMDAKSFQRFIDINSPYDLCYYGAIYQDLEWFPYLIFHFAEGAAFELPVANIFRPMIGDHGKFCLATVSAAPDYPNIIGAVAQQYYNFGYDLTANRVYFENIDCQLLAE